MLPCCEPASDTEPDSDTMLPSVFGAELVNSSAGPVAAPAWLGYPLAQVVRSLRRSGSLNMSSPGMS